MSEIDTARLQADLRRSEAHFRTLVEQVVDYAIIGLDPTGVITSWNAGAERVKLYRSEEAVGRHFSMFYTEADRADGLPARLLEAAASRGHVEHTGWRVRRDGTPFWGNVVITALRDPDGHLTGFAKVTRDLTSMHEFEEARERLFRSFVHDFRTPVAAIAGFAELIPGSPPDLAGALLERLAANARRLVVMSDDLAEYARLTVQRALEVVDLGLADLVTEVVESLPDGIGGDRVGIEVAEGVRVRADHAALERILINLLTNALKYSPTDQPVSVTGTHEPDHVRVVVADRGRGIDPLDLPHIFDEFQRGRRAEDDGGTGLGLASVRRLVEQLGGDVEILAREGGGTAVVLRFYATGD